MSFTGKTTYSSGATLPEIAEDVSDLIGIISPYETPLLDAIGDPLREATSIRHEWIEDELLPNRDQVNDDTFGNPLTDTSFNVVNGGRFRIGDQIQLDSSKELMLVTAISGNTLTVVRQYDGTSAEALADGTLVNIISNAALEGSEKPAVRYTTRARKSNYTQIFTASVEVSGSNIAVSQIGISDEMDYQKQERLRELIRDLENTVINGGMPSSTPQGSDSVRRTMKGIVKHLETNVFTAGQSGFPTGTDLTEEMVNFALRHIWENSSGNIDLIVVGGAQKRRINTFLTALRRYDSQDTAYRNMINIYESDFAACRIITTRWMPSDSVLFLDSSRISVMPLAGRSFHYKQLPAAGDYESGELIGEYTLELKNQAAHGVINGLSTT